MTPPAVLAPSVALERLEQKWRNEAKDQESRGWQVRADAREPWMARATVYAQCADELATLRASLNPAPPTSGECKHERSHGAPWRCAKCGYRFDDATQPTPAGESGAEIERLRELALCVYVGPAAVHDLPESWLDALSAAGHGEPFSCDGLIPYRAQPSGAVEDAARSKYEELIYAVASKFPGETRYETALRYIREREAAANEGGAARLARGGSHD